MRCQSSWQLWRDVFVSMQSFLISSKFWRTQLKVQAQILTPCQHEPFKDGQHRTEKSCWNQKWRKNFSRNCKGNCSGANSYVTYLLGIFTYFNWSNNYTASRPLNPQFNSNRSDVVRAGQTAVWPDGKLTQSELCSFVLRIEMSVLSQSQKNGVRENCHENGDKRGWDWHGSTCCCRSTYSLKSTWRMALSNRTLFMLANRCISWLMCADWRMKRNKMTIKSDYQATI